VLLLGIDNGYEFAAGASVLLHGNRCPVLSVTPSTPSSITALLSRGRRRGHDHRCDGAEALSLHDVAALRGRDPATG
jgi:hypothetical protein